MPDDIFKEIMTVEELAGYLKLPKSTVYKLVREGKIPAQKLGRQWCFKKTVIDHWLEKNREAS